MTCIFYDERQSVDGIESYSPSAGKPRLFVEAAKNYKPRSGGHSFMPVAPVDIEDLYRVHEKRYVDDVFAGRITNGFENNDKRVPESCLWTIGSLYIAADYAANSGLRACSPTSGFHHAGHNFGGGFCTFNGLAAVAAKLIAKNPRLRVGILDCDYHHGNGTEDILNKNPRLTRNVIHRTSGAKFLDADQAGDFFRWLDKSIDEMNDFKCDVVLYQAGADQHIHDPLGGLLSTLGMMRRDQKVFQWLKCGVAWNLAGGYQQNFDNVISLHLQTLGISGVANLHLRQRFEEEQETRQEFHDWLESQGFKKLDTPKRGAVYPGSHIELLWQTFSKAKSIGLSKGHQLATEQDQ